MINKFKKAEAALLIFIIGLLVFGGVQPVAAQRIQDLEELPMVREIEIRGNDHIDTAIVLAAITKTRIGSPWVEQNIIDDLGAIYSLGYFVDPVASFDLIDQNGIRVIFEVIENPVVNGIKIKGATSAPVEGFVDQMQLKSGNVLNSYLLFEDLERFPDWVLDQYGISLRPTSLNISEKGIIEIEVAESIVEKIVIEGNEKTKDHVILRELSFGPGDVLDMNVVNRSLRDVLMLGFFEEIGFSVADGQDLDSTIVTISVAEMKTGSADFGAGYSSRDGLFGYTDISDENFLGNGQRANIYFEIGRGTRTYKIGFYEPYITDNGTSLGGNIYHTRDDIERVIEEDEAPVSGKELVTGLDLTVGHPLGDYTRGSLTLRTEGHSFRGDLEEHVNPYRSFILGGGIATNTTDHPFAPTEGYKNNFKLELGTGLFGADAIYSKVTVDHSRYYQLFRDDIVFAVRGSGGRRLNGELKNNDLFRLGGSETLRGYKYGSEGLVGDKMLLVNAEMRFPIYDFISGVAFTDWGKAWQPGESMDLTSLLNSYGLGVRIDTPLGLLRLDYGWGLNEDNEREGEFYFGVGHTF